MQVECIHHVSFETTDLDKTEAFAQDFGLQTVVKNQDMLIMKTRGKDAYSYVAKKADKNGFIGVSFAVASEADLETATHERGFSAPASLALPGGGTGVSQLDPNGFKIELVHGVTAGEATTPPTDMHINTPLNRTRYGKTQLFRDLGPAFLFRLGHVGLFVKSFAESLKWYEEKLGIIGSDIYHIPGNPNVKIVGFCRLNRGDVWVDHLVLALVQDEKADCHHISFETQDFETQSVAHRFLDSKGYESIWGVGRHPHGSHVFDVWRDPNGYRFETFTDTDLLNADSGTHYHDISKTEVDVWSPEGPEKYFA